MASYIVLPSDWRHNLFKVLNLMAIFYAVFASQFYHTSHFTIPGRPDQTLSILPFHVYNQTASLHQSFQCQTWA
jgi:hypothetical protein